MSRSPARGSSGPDDCDIPLATWDPPTIDVGPSALAPGTTGCEVRWVHRDGRTVVVKRASGRARDRVRREAAVIRALSGLAIVDLVTVVEDDEHTELVLVDAGRRTLSDPFGLSPTTMRRALGATCEAVGAVHERGWALGSVAPEHVIVNGRGRVQLCSLGSAVPIIDDPTAARRDLDRLLEMLDLAATRPTKGSGLARRERHRLRRAVRQLRAEPGTIPEAGHLAGIFSGATGAHRPPRPASLPRLVAGVSLVIAAIGVPIIASTTAGHRSEPEPDRSERSNRASASSTPACLPTDATTPDTDGDGCGNSATVDGSVVAVDGVRYRVGAAGDAVAVGDWNCDGRATPAVLRTSTGEVLQFSRWARTGETLDADPVATIPGAATVRSDHDGRCDHLTVVRADGTEVRVPVDPTPPPEPSQSGGPPP